VQTERLPAPWNQAGNLDFKRRAMLVAVFAGGMISMDETAARFSINTQRRG
jgi:hypothetical protein